jgi:hypothetical protein
MSLARGLERRLEQLMDGIAARLFGGKVHPVELGERLVREADLALTESDTGPVAPNRFKVTLGGVPADTDAIGSVQRELESVLEETSSERGWRLEGPARVLIEVGEGAEASVRVAATVEPGERQPWCKLLPAGGHDLCEVGHNRALVGRSGTCDVHVADPEVSRRHALLWQEAGAIWVADLGAANGTYVNGVPVQEPTAVVAGDVIAFGPASFVLKPV